MPNKFFSTWKTNLSVWTRSSKFSRLFLRLWDPIQCFWRCVVRCWRTSKQIADQLHTLNPQCQQLYFSSSFPIVFIIIICNCISHHHLKLYFSLQISLGNFFKTENERIMDYFFIDFWFLLHFSTYMYRLKICSKCRLDAKNVLFICKWRQCVIRLEVPRKSNSTSLTNTLLCNGKYFALLWPIICSACTNTFNSVAKLLLQYLFVLSYANRICILCTHNINQVW